MAGWRVSASGRVDLRRLAASRSMLNLASIAASTSTDTGRPSMSRIGHARCSRWNMSSPSCLHTTAMALPSVPTTMLAPRSTAAPKARSVHMRPPTRCRASTNVTRKPRLSSWRAAVTPAIPAPMTMTEQHLSSDDFALKEKFGGRSKGLGSILKTPKLMNPNRQRYSCILRTKPRYFSNTQPSHCSRATKCVGSLYHNPRIMFRTDKYISDCSCDPISKPKCCCSS
mmetsp:Transcript_23291/g.40076  ORF Transcript_23291/g.40076 Transcript_23291/m.40076 type:complete len:227 (-) Transcript_23291:304-984(-)